jgi:hypothetical protein
MTIPVSVRIGRVLRKTVALIEAAILTENAEDAYQTFWKRINDTPFGWSADGDSDAYYRFGQAYEDFRQERDTLPAIVLDLKDLAYRYPETIQTSYTALTDPMVYTAMYEAVWSRMKDEMGAEAWDQELAKVAARMRDQEQDFTPPGMLEELREFKAMLEAAWKHVRALQRKRAKPQTISLIPNDEAILRALAKDAPTTMTQEALADVTHLSVRTVRNRLRFLRKKKLIRRPHGSKKGETITAAGLRLIKKK